MYNLENELDYSFFDEPILHIDHSLLSEEIEVYKSLIFSPNNITQIYFKDKCDLKTVLLIKNLLTISDYIDNSEIEKFMLLNLNDDEINSLINMSFKNPEKWNLPYLVLNDDFYLTNIPNLRLINTFINNFKDSDLSPLEVVMKVYDKVKEINYDDNSKYNIPEILKNNSASSSGFNQLFTFCLNKLGYKTYLGEINMDSDSLISLVEIKDDKYGIDGIYLFDPSMDSLPHDKYKKDIRGINYNYFGLNLFSLNNLNYDFKFKKVLSLLSIENYDYAKEKESICKDKDILKDEESITRAFSLSFEELYNKLKRSKSIGIDTIVMVNDRLYPEKNEKYNEYLKYNYNSRKDELFEKNTEEELKDYINLVKN